MSISCNENAHGRAQVLAEMRVCADECAEMRVCADESVYLRAHVRVGTCAFVWFVHNIISTIQSGPAYWCKQNYISRKKSGRAFRFTAFSFCMVLLRQL